MNPERAVVGMATVFGEPDRKEGTVWCAEQFAGLIASQMGVEMWVNHLPPGDPLSLGVVGTWRAFAAIDAFEDQPAGLLTLGDFGHSPRAQDLMERVQQAYDPLSRNGRWGLSVTAADASADEDGSDLRLKEISLTQETFGPRGEFKSGPAFERARVIGVGPYALDVWRLLTGQEPPAVIGLTPRTVRGRLLGIANGRPVYEEWTE